MAEKMGSVENCPPTERSWLGIIPIPDEKVDELKEIFSKFDTNGVGIIPTSSLAQMVRSMNITADEETLEDMMKAADLEGNGTMDVDQFVGVMSRLFLPPMTEANLRKLLDKAFKIFDNDGNGIISARELRCAMVSLGEALTDDEVAQMLEEADMDGDGLVTYQDFMAYTIAIMDKYIIKPDAV